VAVIDDVFTTGATAAALAAALRAAGASHVEIWCLARTPSPGN
jgi:predicted amidophosphoribosyltransferase